MRTIDIRQKERAQRLAKLLRESDLKQSEVARFLKAAPGSVSKWYSGDAAPTGARLEALASLLGVSVDFIRTGKDDGAALDHHFAAAQENMAPALMGQNPIGGEQATS